MVKHRNRPEQHERDLEGSVDAKQEAQPLKGRYL
jgi:hypothetical protein